MSTKDTTSMLTNNHSGFHNGSLVDDDHVLVIFASIATVLGRSIDEINQLTDTTTFVELGGDSLTAILICAECQKRGISIQAGVFLRMLTMKEVIAQAALLAQPLSIPPTISSSLPSLTTPRPSSIASFPNAYYVASMATPVPVESSDDGSSSVSTAITTPDLEAADTSACYHGQEIISAKTMLERINPEEWTEPQLLLLRETSQNQKLNMLTLHETYMSQWRAQDVCNAWTNTILTEPIFQNILSGLDASPQQLILPKIVQVDAEDDYQIEVHNAVNACGVISRLTIIEASLPTTGSEGFTVAIWRIHHAFLDGYSARILRDKIGHNLRRAKTSLEGGPSFKETVNLIQALRLARKESTKRYWDMKREKFSTAIGELRLSPQRVVTETRLPSQRSISIQFPEELLAAARTRTGYTTAVYFAAAWALTLSQFLDADQICFGMVFSGRDLPIPGVFDVVGPLINILPLFVTVPGKGEQQTSVDAFLRRIHDAILELNDVQHSEATEGFYRQFDSIMATQFECDKAYEESLRPLPVDQNRPDMQSGIPMNLIIEQQCRLRIFYSTARYGEEDMNNVRSVFQNSMDGLLQGGANSIWVSNVTSTLLPPEVESELKHWGNCTSSETFDESKGDDLVTLFENVVARQPCDAAVIYGKSESISYDEFDRAAAVVARNLSWINRNEAVCVYADRSVNWLVAIFGILKAGGVYAPLDPSAPESMQHTNFVRSGARVVLLPSRETNYRRSQRARQETGDVNSFPSLALAVDELLAGDAAQISGQYPIDYSRRRLARPDDLAYICFTSGSTGLPKAVQCTHKGLVAFQKDPTVRLAASRGIVVAQVMSPVFDGSIHEIFSALTHGATLRLASPDDQSHPFSHLQDADSAILTPSIAKALDPGEYPRLQNVYLVGEAVPQSIADSWAIDRSLYNMYGPTEATCGATIKRLLPNSPVTLGSPNPSSRVYILDRNQSILPPGAVGELYLAGIQVSHGYIGLPELNNERFLDDSILPKTGQKMYKTGDYAYWDSRTGEVCILGRKDRQIKLRGFRLDLDDLEARVVRAIPGCRGAAVFRQEDHLIAAYQAPTLSVEEPNAVDVKILISRALPPYAIPRQIVTLERFPLTVAGKVDYKSIEKMIKQDGGALTTNQAQKIMSATERMVVDAIRDLMKLETSVTIDRDTNLAALGGHSILQLQLASRISSLIKRQFTVRAVIDSPVISQLAAAVDEAIQEEKADGLAISGQALDNYHHSSVELGDSEISPIELDWFRKYQPKLETSSFNVNYVCKFDESFDQHQRLTTAWNTVLARYTILRCRYRQSTAANSRVERLYAPEPPTASHVETFEIRDEINKEFTLETDNLIRVLISKTNMLVCVSHIICDYTTLNKLLQEVASAYVNMDGVEEPRSVIHDKQYENTTCWNCGIDEKTANFWESYLTGMSTLRKPLYKRASRTSYHGESLLFKLSTDAVSSLQAISQSLHLTLHQVALAIVSLVLQAEKSRKEDLILGSPYLGRQEDDMQTVGLFLQPLPIRIRRQSTGQVDSFHNSSVATFLESVQESARSALSHGIEWSSLMKVLSSSDDEDLRAAAATASPDHPLFDAMVTFHDPSITGQSSSSPLTAAIPGIQPLVSWTEGAKFGIMFEFSALSTSSVTLRVEYDNSLFSSDIVRCFAARIDSGLGLFSEDPSSVRLGDLERDLLKVNTVHPESAVASGAIEEVEFGTPLRDLS